MTSVNIKLRCKPLIKSHELKARAEAYAGDGKQF
ncbi:hypothetical protein ambt_21900 [Alteromonas naphthalenivorans]|uniref:Uncharacterized protein n=1 Tax=Alteromonas naphthalenivorans TaxID=715451 RepID=F5ZGA1_ALTNA|nr:hypothetical protein ambt_21900 [Alteromonas naphthalenivorans]